VRIWGEEPLGLTAARTALARVADGDSSLSECTGYEWLAWALFSNGRDDEAVVAANLAVEAVAEEGEHKDRHRRDVEAIRAAVEAAPATLSATETELAALQPEVAVRRTWSFAPADESQRFLHDTLAELLGKLGSLAAKEKAAVDQRLSWAQQIQQLSLAHPNARHTWAAVRAAIAQNPKYAGQTIDLRDQDITGLVPIGENPVTRLWEFYELRSAWDGTQDPRAIAIPSHEPDGSIEVTGELGIVFVLLPGGTFLMGAQKAAPDGPNFDPAARDDETPHEVTLAPFFLARHELTQGQWARLWSGDASLRSPSQYKAGHDVAGSQITMANPVESVDWTMCDTLLTRHGLVLPTEAQWEYGCRAGTTTPWIVDLTALKTVANVASQDAKPYGVSWTLESWQDGHVVHAPVGAYASNNFGLYDMHGNVWEWCRDWYGTYRTERPGDGLRSGSGSSGRCYRGGSFSGPAAFARSAGRLHVAPALRNFVLGCRPARTSRL
jgi:formylglycine-generating enzyme required for sulfatase activity